MSLYPPTPTVGSAVTRSYQTVHVTAVVDNHEQICRRQRERDKRFVQRKVAKLIFCVYGRNKKKTKSNALPFQVLDVSGQGRGSL